MSEKIDKRIPLNQVPSLYDEEDVQFWKEMKQYWKERGQPWRKEPEIDEERQKFLAERRSITPNSEQGIYPFNEVEPLLWSP